MPILGIIYLYPITRKPYPIIQLHHEILVMCG